MTYRCRQHGARILEVPISFVDRAAGVSKMSSVIVVEALGLVTWWGMGRVLRGLRRGGSGRRAGAPSAMTGGVPASDAGDRIPSS